MWYYKLLPTIKNIHKIIFYILISFIQVKRDKTYKKYKFLNGHGEEFKRYHFLNNLQICENKSIDCDCLLLLDKFSFIEIIKNIKYLTRLRIYDINYFGHFGLSMILKILYYDFTDSRTREFYNKNSLKNLAMLKEYCLNKVVNLLGNNSDYSNKKKKIINSVVMVCNDAISDTDIIKKNLSVLAVADPLFFFSETEYSQNYLKILKENEQKLNFLIIPKIALPVILKLNISIPLILINSKTFQKKLFKLKNNEIFTIKTHNIFTQIMLPIAVYIDEPIRIGGFTIKNSKDHNKLWSYDTKVVKNNSKNFAFKYSFFKDRNFKKYYSMHFKNVNKFLHKINNVHEL